MSHLRGIRNLWLGTRRSKYGSRFQKDFHRQKLQSNLVNCLRSTNVLLFRDNKTVSWTVTVDGPVRMSLYRSVRLVRSIGTSNNQGIPVSVPATFSQRLWFVSCNIHWKILICLSTCIYEGFFATSTKTSEQNVIYNLQKVNIEHFEDIFDRSLKRH